MDPRYVDGFGLLVNVVVVVAFTTCVTAAEVLVRYVALPPYDAVRESLPTGNVLSVSCACPPLTVADPSDVAPLKNCTVPVADDGETVAVKVTEAPMVEGFGLLPRTVDVASLFTVCVTLPEALALYVPSPV